MILIPGKVRDILCISAVPMQTINPGGNQCKGHRVKKEYVDEDVLRLIQSHMKKRIGYRKNDPGNELRFQKPDAIFAFGQGSRETLRRELSRIQ